MIRESSLHERRVRVLGDRRAARPPAVRDRASVAEVHSSGARKRPRADEPPGAGGPKAVAGVTSAGDAAVGLLVVGFGAVPHLLSMVTELRDARVAPTSSRSSATAAFIGAVGAVSTDQHDEGFDHCPDDGTRWFRRQPRSSQRGASSWPEQPVRDAARTGPRMPVARGEPGCGREPALSPLLGSSRVCDVVGLQSGASGNHVGVDVRYQRRRSAARYAVPACGTDASGGSCRIHGRERAKAG